MHKIPNWKLMLVQVLYITCFILASKGDYTSTQEYCEPYFKCPPIVINPPQLIAGQPIPPIVIDSLNESQLAKEQPIPPIAIDPPPPENLPGQPPPPITLHPPSQSQPPGRPTGSPYQDQPAETSPIAIHPPSQSQSPGISTGSP